MRLPRQPQRFVTPRKRNAFTLVELLVVIAIIGILVALLLPAVQSAREAARRAQCQSQIKNVALAMLNYESARGVFPSGIISPEPGTTHPRFGAQPPSIGNNPSFTGGWLIEILPQYEEQPLYDSFDFEEPIAGGFLANGPSAPNWPNIQARGQTIGALLCPTDSNNRVPYSGTSGLPANLNKLGDNWARGNYAANAGAGQTSNAGGGVLPLPMNTPRSDAWRGLSTNPNWPAAVRGVVGPNTAVRIAQITDGTSKTMMVAEIRSGVNEGDPRGSWALCHSGGNMVSAHGSGGDSIGPNYCGDKADDVSSFLTRMDCAAARVDCMGCNLDPFGFAQASPRSLHPSGVNIALADGSVRFLTDDIETPAGEFAPCCTAYDHLIMSADADFVGP